jgi:simple sugar transport system permease protein
MNRTLPGYQVRVIGSAPRAGRFAGFSEAWTTIFVLLLSGAIAGLAGMIEISSSLGQLQPNISFGYGFTAIIVAFLARLNPIGVIFAGLLIALAELGGDNAQIALGIPKVVTGIFKGILLFFILAGETLHQYRIEISLPKFSPREASS